MQIASIAQKIKNIRTKQRLTQQQLATLADINRVTVAKLEIGKNKSPTIPTLAAIARALRCALVVDFIPKAKP